MTLLRVIGYVLLTLLLIAGLAGFALRFLDVLPYLLKGNP